jgi:hypothetical protein
LDSVRVGRAPRCAGWAEHFSAVDAAQLRSCLARIPRGQSVAYRLVGSVGVDEVGEGGSPRLELQDPELAPACLRTLAPRLPVPREIFFQSNAEGSIRCYSSALPPDLGRVAVRLSFPLEGLAQDDPQAFLRRLGTWTIAAYWPRGQAEAGSAIRARITPDSICRACLGAGNLVTEFDPPPLTYP